MTLREAKPMFDNRWENWAGDFSESFSAGLLDPTVRNVIPDIQVHFGREVRKHDRDFPDRVSPGTFATVLSQAMPRLSLPESARRHVPEVVARFLEYLRESGRVGEGDEWAAEVREIGSSDAKHPASVSAPKGETIRKPAGVSPLGRNDPCPCGSGKKFKKCCMGKSS